MRMRFTKAEREAFTVGADVEIRNGRFWYPAIVTGPLGTTPGGTFQEIPCRVTDAAGRKGTVRKGDTWSATPTYIRTPQ